LWLVIGTISVLVYAYLAATSGLEVRMVGLLQVYDLREEYRAKLKAIGTAFGYLVGWQGNVINPIIIVRGLLARRLGLVVAGCLGQLVLFSLTGFKTFMLAMPSLMFIVWLIGRRSELSRSTLLWGAVVLCGTAVSLDRLFDSMTWTSIFVRRFILTSGMLTSTYVLFFADRPHLYLSHSVLKEFIPYPYNLPYPRAIGEYVTGSASVSMNANVFADGFANAGWAGVGGVALILAALLALIDDASRGLPLVVPCAIFLLSAITLSNTAVLTTIWTHGLAVAIVLVAFLPRSGWESSRRIRVRRKEIRDLVRDSGRKAPATTRSWTRVQVNGSNSGGT
jgi:hypothetical protein